MAPSKETMESTNGQLRAYKSPLNMLPEAPAKPQSGNTAEKHLAVTQHGAQRLPDDRPGNEAEMVDIVDFSSRYDTEDCHDLAMLAWRDLSVKPYLKKVLPFVLALLLPATAFILYLVGGAGVPSGVYLGVTALGGAALSRGLYEYLMRFLPDYKNLAGTYLHGDVRNKLWIGVARGGGQVVATGAIIHEDHHLGKAEIVRLNVRPDFRRRGLARALLRRALRHLAAQGYGRDDFFICSSEIQVYQAERFYVSEGFVVRRRYSASLGLLDLLRGGPSIFIKASAYRPSAPHHVPMPGGAGATAS